jgi:two-component system sensor histidine kinase YcbA
MLLGMGMWLTAELLREGRWRSFIVLGLLDVGANVGELIFRREFFASDLLAVLYLLSVVALMRATLVGLAYTAWRQHDHIVTQQQKQREFERMLLITSDVSGELLYLESTLHELEKIMLQSYQLYARLSVDKREDGEASLAIARDIHDAKKDFQRLAARLRQVIVRSQDPEEVGLQTLVGIAVRANKAMAEQQKKRIEIAASVVGDARIMSHHSLLSILNNLMGNAIEAIGDTGRISVSVAREDDHLLVRVEDTGVGIDQQNMPHIFRAGYTTKFDPLTGQASTGLGLVQVRYLVENMGGAISVESKIGVGSSFSVTLPLKEGSLA